MAGLFLLEIGALGVEKAACTVIFWAKLSNFGGWLVPYFLAKRCEICFPFFSNINCSPNVVEFLLYT